MKLPAPGRMVDIGGRRLHALDAGAGRVAVLLEAGAGGWCLHWGDVPARLARVTRTIAYDRGGMGWSDPGPHPRDADSVVGEVALLLRALEVTGPVILVGHSLGGSFMRLASRRLPNQITGVVFVDGWHEAMKAWEERTGNTVTPPRWAERLGLWAGRLGLLSVLARIAPTPASPWPMVDPGRWEQIYRMSASRKQVLGAQAEALAFEHGDRQVATITTIDAPIAVLAARNSLSPPDAPPGFPVADYNRAWLEAAAALAALSGRSETTVLDDTDHLIPFCRPDAVVTAVEGLLAIG